MQLVDISALAGAKAEMVQASVSMTGFSPRNGSSLRLKSRERSKFEAVRKICATPLTSIVSRYVAI